MLGTKRSENEHFSHRWAGFCQVARKYLPECRRGPVLLNFDGPASGLCASAGLRAALLTVAPVFLPLSFSHPIPDYWRSEQEIKAEIVVFNPNHLARRAWICQMSAIIALRADNIAAVAQW